MLPMLLLAADAVDPVATTAAAVPVALGPVKPTCWLGARAEASAEELEEGSGCGDNQFSGQRGLKKGRAIAVANERIIDATNSSHMAASAAAVEDASAAASMRQAATDCAPIDNAVVAFMPRDEFGRRRKMCRASIIQQTRTTAAGAVGRAPVVASVAPPAIPMAARRQQRTMNVDNAAEPDVCMCSKKPQCCNS